ncbi:NAD(P)H-hydrate dehydratase [Loktanella agnita]|uniref:NAD(P)H-hydrate dehydratase n=1 Tax=Loktanella agnita TaxID=287097 RepID=UPI0039868EA7
MTELLTAAQMRAIEQAAIESGNVAGLELMERAGQGAVGAILAEWPELGVGEHRVVVLCGPGNNGGDGFVIARLLKEAGWEVDVSLYGDAGNLPPDAKVNYERWAAMGAIRAYRIDPPPLVDDYLKLPDRFDLLIDAVFGSGLTRPFTGLFTIIALGRERLTEAGVKCVAVDVPSGLCADSGRVLGCVIPADLTVTFHRQKVGHFLNQGPEVSTKISVADIGIEGSPRSRVGAVGGCPAAPGDAIQLVETPRQLDKFNGHKYSHGHALILSGGVGKGGAARLSARGALRIGAGAVTIGCPPAALIENAAQLTAIMLTAVKDVYALNDILKDDRINALCLGPGFGVGDREKALLAAVLEHRSPGRDPGPQPAGQSQGPGSRPGLRRIVLDADVLSLLAQDESLFAKLHKDCVLTPHGGEFARLFPDIAERLNQPASTGPAYSKVDATRDAAKRSGCVILFKGPDTVIADPSGRCSINAAVYERSAHWLATAGSGDVLAGFITGLLARGFDPMHAAKAGAWLHTECARSFGPGLIAEDLPEELPKVFRTLGL